MLLPHWFECAVVLTLVIGKLTENASFESVIAFQKYNKKKGVNVSAMHTTYKDYKKLPAFKGNVCQFHKIYTKMINQNF